jgi:hypothetical protein
MPLGKQEVSSLKGMISHGLCRKNLALHQAQKEKSRFLKTPGQRKWLEKLSWDSIHLALFFTWGQDTEYPHNPLAKWWRFSLPTLHWAPLRHSHPTQQSASKKKKILDITPPTI